MKKTIEKLIKFRDERKWQDLHTPERLANSTLIEAGELAKLFQWGKEPSQDLIKDEIADVMIYCLYLCEKYDFDIKAIINEKIEKNGQKYKTGVNPEKYGWDLK
jgi:NTP pyrophosphatase (non-canonical NTP hydrolase)